MTIIKFKKKHIFIYSLHLWSVSLDDIFNGGSFASDGESRLI